ncbi:MAG: DUF47 family protein [Methanothermobacter thermautotrophicus]|uniref:DUF47 family protein n=1 Tax=Methanothermobacter defluvii TaxID=49339 RepID=UPI0024825712|nr:DUF47 family protein [Methanothermobacter defluvii]
MKFFLKESKVEKHGRQHLEKVMECYLKFEELMEAFYRGGLQAGLRTHKGDSHKGT